LHQWGTRKMNGETIESVYNVGKLVLLSKNHSPFPIPEETRPIVVFSIVRKYLERMWLEKYGKLLWENIGYHQGGFREGHGTQEVISKLCNWIHSNRKGAIILFIDVKKAFDSVNRAQVIECVKNAGVDDIGIKILSELLNNTILVYKSNEITYDKGVPQGSVLSPVLFNLVYEVILKEAVKSGWFVQAYADDLVIGIKCIEDYVKVLKWIDSWKPKVCLEVNENKTKEFRIGKYKNTNGRYQSVDEFKYLGVCIYSSRVKQCAKSRCSLEIKKAMRIPFLVTWSIHRANYFCLLWWFISYVLYLTTHGIVCGFYDVEFIVSEATKRIRKISNAPPRMSNKILMEFYGINLSAILEQTVNKIKFKMGIIKSFVKQEKTKYETIWFKAVSAKKITPKLFTSYYAEFAWNGRNILKCKICNKQTSLRHLFEHNLLSETTFSFFTNVATNGIYKTMEVMKIKDDSGV